MFSSNFAKNVGQTLVANIYLLIAGLILSIVVARFLGPYGKGVFSIATALSTIGVQLGLLGLHSSNTYYVARDKSLLSPLIGNSLLVGMGIASFLSGVLWVIFRVFPGFLNLQGVILTMALMLIPFSMTGYLVQSLILGINYVKVYNVLNIVKSLLNLIFVLLVILIFEVNPATIFFAGLVSIIFTTLISCWWIRRFLDAPPRPSLPLLIDSYKYGFKAYLAALFAYIVLRFDVIMVFNMLGNEPTGWYSISANMADKIYLLPATIGTLLFPKLSAMATIAQRWDYTKKVIRIITAIMIFITVFGAIIAKPAIEILYGNSFAPAAPSFVWLMPGILALSINTVFMNYFASSGMPIFTVYSPAIAAIVNILLNLKLIPIMGIVGAAVSSSISYCLMLVLSILYQYSMRKDCIKDGFL